MKLSEEQIDMWIIASMARCEHGIQTSLQMCWQCKDKQDRAAKDTQLAALKSENTALTAARDLALASLNKQDAEIDALKAENEKLRKALVEFVQYADDCDDDSPELDRARAALANKEIK